MSATTFPNSTLGKRKKKENENAGKIERQNLLNYLVSRNREISSVLSSLSRTNLPKSIFDEDDRFSLNNNKKNSEEFRFFFLFFLCGF
jgi:hypothetical protein